MIRGPLQYTLTATASAASPLVVDMRTTIVSLRQWSSRLRLRNPPPQVNNAFARNIRGARGSNLLMILKIPFEYVKHWLKPGCRESLNGNSPPLHYDRLGNGVLI